VNTLLKLFRPSPSPVPAGPRRPADVLVAAVLTLAAVGLGPALAGPASAEPVRLCPPAPVLATSDLLVVAPGPGGTGPTDGGSTPLYYDPQLVQQVAAIVAEQDAAEPPLC
jgi:hypothetical protein